MDYAMVDIVWTVIAMVVFIGIVLWAWSGKRRKAFDEAANIPFSEDAPPGSGRKSEENTHG